MNMLDGIWRSPPQFLASVVDDDEARLACAFGAGIIDCKAPQNGALGALPHRVVRNIVNTIAGRLPVSATIGDLQPQAEILIPAAEAMAAAGVDIVKVGVFANEGAAAAIGALGGAALGRARLYAVLMADRAPNLRLVDAMASAGFLGVMLDTADKSAGSLPDVMSESDIKAFVGTAHQLGLVAGLAGSLRLDHVQSLVKLGPDVLGFRGALCCDGRTSRLEANRVAAVRGEIERARAATRVLEGSIA